MKLSKLYIAIWSTAAIISGCVTWQPTALSPVLPTDHIDSTELKKIVRIPVLENNGGVIDDFEKDMRGWKVTHPNAMSIERIEGNMVLTADGVGPNWEYLIRTFKPLDFSEANTVVVRAKIDGWKIPYIRMDLKDKNGVQTNAKLTICKLAPRTDYQDYIFRFKDKFNQNWPYKATVDSTQISQIQIAINEGSIPYTGTIYIDEVRVIREEW